jgi:hypothetical protein
MSMSEARHGDQPWPQEPPKDHPAEPDWGTPPKKRLSSNRRWALAGAIALIVIAGVNAIPDDDQAEAVTPTAAAAGPAAVLITLEGSLADSADITVKVGNDITQSTVDVPMKSATTGEPGLAITAQPGSFVYFSAQNDSEYGDLTCVMTSNGRTVSTSYTDVDYGIVTCSGTV